MLLETGEQQEGTDIVAQKQLASVGAKDVLGASRERIEEEKGLNFEQTGNTVQENEEFETTNAANQVKTQKSFVSLFQKPKEPKIHISKLPSTGRGDFPAIKIPTEL